MSTTLTNPVIATPCSTGKTISGNTTVADPRAQISDVEGNLDCTVFTPAQSKHLSCVCQLAKQFVWLKP